MISLFALVFGAASPATSEFTQRFEDVIFVTGRLNVIFRSWGIVVNHL